MNKFLDSSSEQRMLLSDCITFSQDWEGGIKALEANY